ncbi:hypothetical protein F1559_000370 [Cyanidiococcus yangmingshanensis]|uniref:DUF1826 domain-containing protein n=1 Tax=Cyanidiococcus yangmingshanensis TaxID=2690220 RepID=A0A7J7IEW3_9RHOD|nr:hypothetical protein F1559_000370 [Cyanidiococcus yangmingshanensis]
MIGIFGASLQVPATQEWSSTIQQYRYVDLRLSYLNSTPCPRFHTDSVPLRMLCTLEGPGTEIARETYVWRERFETARQVGSTFRINKPWWWRWQRHPKTLATCTAAEHAQQVVFRPGIASAATITTTPRCDRASTPDAWAIHDPRPGAPIERLLPWHAAFLKGTEWTQVHGSTNAVIHRSPTMASNERRWLFQIDLHVFE